jgi:hypothetical protein
MLFEYRTSVCLSTTNGEVNGKDGHYEGVRESKIEY